MSSARVSLWIPSSTLSKPGTRREQFDRISLTLEQMYGAIAIYLAHEQEIDANLREGEAEIKLSVQLLSESRQEIYARLERVMHELKAQNLAKH